MEEVVQCLKTLNVHNMCSVARSSKVNGRTWVQILKLVITITDLERNEGSGLAFVQASVEA